jgi:hypothetical protein
MLPVLHKTHSKVLFLSFLEQLIQLILRQVQWIVLNTESVGREATGSHSRNYLRRAWQYFIWYSVGLCGGEYLFDEPASFWIEVGNIKALLNIILDVDVWIFLEANHVAEAMDLLVPPNPVAKVLFEIIPLDLIVFPHDLVHIKEFLPDISVVLLELQMVGKLEQLRRWS